MAGQGRHADRHFGNNRAAPANLVVQLVMFGRINHIDATRENRDRTGFERRAVRRMVDAACHPGHHHQPRAAEIACEHIGKFDPEP